MRLAAPSPGPSRRPAKEILETVFRISRAVENGPPLPWHGSNRAPYSLARMSDLFSSAAAPDPSGYDASSIEVLEGLEPVRRRPGMYIGGTDARALHHLAAEVIDNAMDEAVAGHASRIEVTLEPGNRLTVSDNGRGIPVDPHPKYPKQSALEVIMTTLHSGGKFEGKAYSTSGGLHGVGVSVVNALSSETVVEVARDRKLYRQSFAKGLPTSKLEEIGAAPNRRGTTLDLRSRRRNLRRRREVRPRPPAQARPLQGLPLRRRRDPLALRSLAGDGRSARNRRLPVRQRPRRPPRRAIGRARLRHQPALRRQAGLPQRPGQRRMGGRLAALFATAARAITATPSPRPTAAPTKPAFAPR